MKMYAATIPAEVLHLKPRHLYYARQKQLFVLVFLAVAVVPLFCINWYASHYYENSWLKKTSAELTGIAESRREIVDRFLAAQENQLAGLVAFGSLETLGRQKELERLFAGFKRDGAITDLGVIDREGNHRAYVGPYSQELAGKNYADTPWFHEAMGSGRYISDIFSGYRKVPHVIVAVADPERTWLLRATINSELFNALVASANVGEGGDAFIINTKGELQTPSRQNRDGLKNEQVAKLTAVANEDRGPQRVGNHLYAVTPLKGGDWLLVLETDLRTALADFYQARHFGLLLILAASAVIFVVAALVINSMMNRIAKADQQRMTLTNNVRHVEKMALVGRLAASVAHEINNPLQIITDQAGWINELLDDEDKERVANLGEYRSSLARIRAQVKRAGAITHRLLGFSRLRDEEWSATDLNRAAEETIALLENEAKNHHITIRRSYAPTLPPVRTDASQLQQVFLNILNNAMDAIGQNGVIEVVTRLADPQVAIEFRDNGPGLPPAVMGRIFDSFFTTKQKGKGTGLGLSISQHIVERLGGTIHAANREEGGSVFTVALPLPTAHAQANHLPKMLQQTMAVGR
ncbi:MAG: ATP-binding protein [Thermodesulfobacteriota bacterium]